MPASTLLVAVCSEGLCVGAGTIVFGVLAVQLWVRSWRARDPYFIIFRLSLITFALSMCCALLVVLWFMRTTGVTRVVLTISAALGVVLAVLGWHRLRQHGQEQTDNKS